MACFADATFLVALLNKDDAHHEEAVEALAAIIAEAGSAPPLVFTDYVFDEVLTTLLYRTQRHGLAVRAGEMLLAGRAARMVAVSQVTFRAAWEMFRDRPDKKWSFTDCTSFRTMEELGLVTAVTFDGDFSEAGFAVRP